MDARLSAHFTVLHEARGVLAQTRQVVEIESINASVTTLFPCLPAGLTPVHLAVLANVVPLDRLVRPAVDLLNAKVRHRAAAGENDHPHASLAGVAFGEKAPPLGLVVVDDHCDCLLFQVVQLAVLVDKHDDL